MKWCVACCQGLKKCRRAEFVSMVTLWDLPERTDVIFHNLTHDIIDKCSGFVSQQYTSLVHFFASLIMESVKGERVHSCH